MNSVFKSDKKPDTKEWNSEYAQWLTDIWSSRGYRIEAIPAINRYQQETKTGKKIFHDDGRPAYIYSWGIKTDMVNGLPHNFKGNPMGLFKKPNCGLKSEEKYLS